MICFAVVIFVLSFLLSWQVCTDIAARGLDMPDVNHVVMFDFPLNPIDYLHRSGVPLITRPEGFVRFGFAFLGRGGARVLKAFLTRPHLSRGNICVCIYIHTMNAQHCATLPRQS